MCAYERFDVHSRTLPEECVNERERERDNATASNGYKLHKSFDDDDLCCCFLCCSVALQNWLLLHDRDSINVELAAYRYGCCIHITETIRSLAMLHLK